MSKNNEQKEERFKRLAGKRVRKVLDDIRIVSNLSNRGLYDYTPEQLRKIFGAMKDAITKAEARFRGEEKEEKNFEL